MEKASARMSMSTKQHFEKGKRIAGETMRWLSMTIASIVKSFQSILIAVCWAGCLAGRLFCGGNAVYFERYRFR